MSSPLILIRAAITPEEWKAIRKRAIDEGVPTADLVANGLRASLLKEKTK